MICGVNEMNLHSVEYGEGRDKELITELINIPKNIGNNPTKISFIPNFWWNGNNMNSQEEKILSSADDLPLCILQILQQNKVLKVMKKLRQEAPRNVRWNCREPRGLYEILLAILEKS